MTSLEPDRFEIAHRFCVEGLLGEGGMGEVFRAYDRVTGEAAAIKRIRGVGDAERFEREAEVLSTLCHPCIVRYLGHGTTEEGDPWLATELLVGEDLARRLERGPLAVREAIALGRSLAGALGYAHELGLVHRDIKPANIFLREGRAEDPCLLDFGLARAVGVSDLTGTDARADVFSLGCVLYHCLTGRSPFGEDSEGFPGSLDAVLHRRPPAVASLRADVPALLRDLVERMLAKAPSQRPADGVAVRVELALIEKLRGRPVADWGDESATTIYLDLPEEDIEVEIEPEAEVASTVVTRQPWWDQTPEPSAGHPRKENSK